MTSETEPADTGSWWVDYVINVLRRHYGCDPRDIGRMIEEIQQETAQSLRKYPQLIDRMADGEFVTSSRPLS